MSAEEFLNQLEERGLLDTEVLDDIRGKVASSAFKISPAAVAEMLVAEGHLTKFQSEKLLGAALAGEAKAKETKAAETKAKDTKPAEKAKPAKSASPPPPVVEEEDLGLAPSESGVDLTPTKPAPKPEPAKGKPEKEKQQPAAGKSPVKPAAKPAPPPDDDLTVVLDEGEAAAPAAPAKKPAAAEAKPEKKTPATNKTAALDKTTADKGGANKKKPAAPAPIAAGGELEEVVDGLEPVEDDTGLQEMPGADLIDIEAGLSPIAGGGLQPAAGLQPLDAGGLTALDDAALGAGGLDPFGGGAAQLAPPKPKSNISFKKQVGVKKPWESKLMMGGSAVLLLMVILGVVLFFSLGRGSASEMFAAAEKAYSDGSYAQAISLYEKFLQNFPKDPSVSLARVKIGTAKLWQTLGGNDKQPALKAVKEILPTIENEESFGQVRNELATILPDIAAGFSSQAKASDDVVKAQQLVDLAKEAMTFVNNPAYVPTSLRSSIQTKLAAIDEDINSSIYKISRIKDYTKAVAEIRTAAEADDSVNAYDIYRVLWKKYATYEFPDQHPELLAALTLISEREQKLVKTGPVEAMPATEDNPAVSKFRVALASRRGDGDAGNAGQFLFVLARGGVYGIAANSGKLLWRRFVGHETIFQPQPTSRLAGADALVSDSHRNEVLRLEGASGKLKWRLPIGEAFAEPVLSGQRMFVATASGRLLDIDIATGQPARQATIGQGLETGPGLSKSSLLFQIGKHSHLYVLAADSLECRKVYYLGHKPGTVVVPPISSLNYVFVCENHGPGACTLHILAVDEGEAKIERPKQTKSIALKGNVLVPPLLYGARLVVVTDLGEIHIFEVNPAKPDTPVGDAVEPQVASFQQPIIGYAAIDGTRLVVGNERLNAFEVQTSSNRLLGQWMKTERDVFVAPPQILGDTLYTLRRRRGSPSYSLAALKMADGKPLWEIDLAAPPALNWFDETAKQIHAITSEAELFEVDPTVFQAGLADQPKSVAVNASRTVPFTEVTPLDPGRFALTSPDDRSKFVLYDSKSATPSGRLTTVKVKAAAESKVAAAPAFFQGGLLMPLDNGQVPLVNVQTGDNLGTPFQPPVEAGSKVQWSRPAVAGGAVVIGDDRRKLYRVVAAGSPPGLSAAKQADLDAPFAAGLIAAGDAIYGVFNNGAATELISFSAADLSLGERSPLAGRLAWGPVEAGANVLLATDANKLYCFGPDKKKLWDSSLVYGPLVGKPLVQGGDLILVSTGGTIWKIAAADGAEKAKLLLDEPLGLGATPFVGGRLLLSGADGTLHIVDPL